MTEKLKKCPFCGGEAYFHVSSIRCDGCNVRLAGVQGEEEAIKAWNNRPIEAQLQECVDELEKHLMWCFIRLPQYQTFLKKSKPFKSLDIEPVKHEGLKTIEETLGQTIAENKVLRTEIEELQKIPIESMQKNKLDRWIKVLEDLLSGVKDEKSGNS